MATKPPTRRAAAKVTTTTVTTEPAEGAPAPEEQRSIDDVMQQQANDSLVALMAELGSIDGSRCTVHRAEKNQPLEYVFACSPSEFSLDDLRDKYGGGTFRLFVTKPGHTGVWRNMLVHVARTTVAPVTADPNAAMMALMREGFARQAEVLKAALTPPAPAGEPLTMASVLPQLPAIITALAAAVTALRPPTPAPVAQREGGMNEGKAIDLFIRGVELAKDLNGGGGDGDGGGLMGILREFVKSPMMGAAVQALAQPAAQPAQPQRAQLPAPQPQVAPVPTPAPQPAQPTVTTPEPNATLAYYLGMLCAMSQNGKDPDLYADLVLDNAPDELLTPLLQAEDGVAFLAQFHPPVEQHRQWFSQLIATIRAAMNDTSHMNGSAGGHVDGGDAPVLQGAGATVNPPPQ